jgi:hypothetical protein
MPRYFFHLTNEHRSTRDPDGVELPDASAARKEAVEMVVGLLGESAVTGHDWTGWRVEICDSDGRCTLVIPFSEVRKS